MNFKDKSVMVLATGFFAGYIPFAPGTFGSIVGLPICFLLSKTKLSVAILFILIFIFFAIWISNRAEKILKQNDPGCIVIDEIAGIMFDILKPFPIRYIERRFAGGTGVVMDDLMAGVYSNIVLRLLFIYLGRL